MRQRTRSILATATLLLASLTLSCSKFDASPGVASFLLLQQLAVASASGVSTTVSGTVSGLSSGTLVLQINGGETVSIAAPATSFTFPTPLTPGTSYTITIGSQPSGHTCSLNNNAGTMGSGGVTNVSITCIAVSLIGGSVSGVPTFSGSPQVVTIGGVYPGPTSGYQDGTGTAARFNNPQGITTDGTYLYISDTGNDCIRRMKISTVVVNTLAGNCTNQGYQDGIGTTARFDGPRGLTTDGTFLYVTDKNNNSIRRVEIATGTVVTVAGAAPPTTGANGYLDGTGTASRFDSPMGITTDGNYLYVSDTNNNRIRKIAIGTWVVTTLAGDGTTAIFNTPRDLTVTGGKIYVADNGNNRIQMVVVSTGVVSTITNANPDVVGIRGLTTDGTNLYFTKVNSSFNAIRDYPSLASGATSSVLAGQNSAGFVDGAALTTALLNNPTSIVSSGTKLYFVDTNNSAIRYYY